MCVCTVVGSDGLSGDCLPLVKYCRWVILRMIVMLAY